MLNINSEVPRYWPLISIVYEYKYPDLFVNVSISSVSHLLGMSKFFGYVNEVYSHNKSMQSDLSLETYFVT